MKNKSLNAMLEHSLIGVVLHNYADGSIDFVNDAAAKLLGFLPSEISGAQSLEMDWHFVNEHGDRLTSQDYPYNQIKRTEQPIHNCVYGIKHSDGELVWVMLNGYIEQHETHDKLIVIIINDITTRTRSFSFEKIVQNTHDMVIVTDAGNIEYPSGPSIVYVNKAFENMTGYSMAEVKGKTPRLLQGKDTDPKVKKKIYAAIKNRKAIKTTLLNYTKSNQPYWVEINIVPLKNNLGEVTHFVGLQRDITKQKEYLQRLENTNKSLENMKQQLEKLVEQRTSSLQEAKDALERIAFLDPLTDIPNRRFFFQHAEKLMQLASRHNLIIIVGILDIDDFKSINDEYGHQLGDDVLICIGNVLQTSFRSEDLYCRYGGEEFAICMAVEDKDEIEQVGQRLLKSIREVCLNHSGQDISLSASFGIACACAPLDCGLDALLRRADSAMYTAKSLGKDQYHIDYDLLLA